MTNGSDSSKLDLSDRLIAFAVSIIAERWDSVETGIDWEYVDDLLKNLELTYTETTTSIYGTGELMCLDPELQPLIDRCLAARDEAQK